MTDQSETSNEIRTDGGDVSREEASFVEYGIEDKPPLGESILLGIQHYLTMIGATVAIPLVLAGAMEMPAGETARLIGTFFVVSGIATLLQTTVGNRYPIVQGGTFALLAPALAVIGALAAEGVGWQTTLLELQGAIIAAATVQVILGYVGALGKLKYYLSPVVIAPVIVLIGLSLVGVQDVTRPDQNWWLLGLTLFLIVLFSQYLDRYSRYAKLFPVLLGIVTAWVVAAILSVTGVYGPETVGYVDTGAIAEASAIQVITPLQWGMPQFTPAFAVGIFAGVLASMVESLGDYYAVARIAGVGAPSEKRINHGIGMEGIGNIIAGIMGTGNGSTSYGENIGAIGITGVASRYVVQIGAIVMLIVGFVGYFGALITTIPSPIVGALYIAMFGQIAAIGLSNLRYVDLDASRNVFIIGIALFLGLSVPQYMDNVGGAAEFQQIAADAALVGPVLGQPLIADTIFVIGSTTMAVGGIIAFVLDNTVRGTRDERGLTQWEQLAEDEEEFVTFFESMRSSDEPTPVDRAD
ncbi:xanthine permease [Halobiforma lacisalsi AJ5]|uniref:Xanthine permease n=2 Tax=Natronobacterium TaxID=2256 RepID=M0LQ93_NATLA|nr:MULTISPECIES: solute carrier family 23 protein [Halobiforma]APW96909.1 xanthine permease [Halobiforma lacisalsi AJ5]EMA34619.1 xanthine/uracil permease family protein [Halobiforma lacisalsi AJ5]SFC28857.1 uracil-xanthine permease [Halobiforma haloterrestris]